MQKIASETIPDKVLDDLKQKISDDKVKAAMLMYLDSDDNMFMYGDAHSISYLVTNLVFSALHEHLHNEENKFEERQTFGMEGFIPDASSSV